MKTKIAAVLLVSAALASGVCRAQDTLASDSGAPIQDISAEVLPLVQFDDAPLVDVIKTLARQASLNIIFDPAVVQMGPDGSSPYPPVTIRLENVSAQNVLESILNNNNLRLERDVKTKISRVTVKDPAAAEPLLTKTYQLKFTSPSNIVSILKPMIGARSQALMDVRTSQIILFATEDEILEVDDLIVKLDTATKQVLIEARVFETLRNPETMKGFNWAGTFKAQNVYFGNNAYGGTGNAGGSTSDSANSTVAPDIQPGLMAFLRSGYVHPAAYLNADGARAVFSFFNEDTQTETLATPRAVTADNETAHLSVSRAIPIFEVTQGGTQTGNSVNITYTNLGVILDVTPRISAENQIALKVRPEISGVEGQDVQVIDGETYTANIFNIRTIETSVLIPSGNTLVLGGLLSDETKKTGTKVPILGDIPGMKYIFGSRGKSATKANLLIFVTPTVIEESDFQVTESTFLQTPVPADTSPTDMGSFDEPWDGVIPYDWSKPVY